MAGAVSGAGGGTAEILRAGVLIGRASAPRSGRGGESGCVMAVVSAGTAASLSGAEWPCDPGHNGFQSSYGPGRPSHPLTPAQSRGAADDDRSDATVPCTCTRLAGWRTRVDDVTLRAAAVVPAADTGVLLYELLELGGVGQ